MPLILTPPLPFLSAPPPHPPPQAKDSVKQVIEQYQAGQLEAMPGRSMQEAFEQKVNAMLNKARDDAGKKVRAARRVGPGDGVGLHCSILREASLLMQLPHLHTTACLSSPTPTPAHYSLPFITLITAPAGFSLPATPLLPWCAFPLFGP